MLARGSHLMDIHGVGPAGTVPIDASSGEHTHHRLPRAGNRRLNHVLYIAGIVQLRNDTEGWAYCRRKRDQGKTSMEAMRCLCRRLSDVVNRQLVADAAARTERSVEAGPGGHSGTTTQSSATGLTPHTGPSDKPLPGPATTTLPSLQPTRKSPVGRHQAYGVDAPEVSTWSTPPDERR